MKLRYQSHSGFLLEHRINQLDYPPHIHNAVELVFLTRGSSIACCGNQRKKLEAGEIFVAFPNQIHSYEDSTDAEGYVLILPVKPCLAPYSAILARQLPEDAFLPKGSWEHTALLPLVEQAYKDMPTVSEQVMDGYMLVIFGKLLPLLQLREVGSGSAESLRAVLEYLGEHYREPLTRASIARAVGYNESYISHMFSGNLNTTLPEYINSLRVLDASLLLVQTDLPVTRIASDLGFGSIRNFNRAFQKVMGISPRAYRACGGKQQEPQKADS